MSSSIRKSKSVKNASNNPYKHLSESLLNDADGVTSDIPQDPPQEQQAFMSFTPKINVTNTDIQRRYTQKKPPPNSDDFMTEFEQHSTKPLTRQDSQSSKSVISYDDDQEIEDFSDTARLTVNASSVSGFNQNNTRSKSTLRVDRYDDNEEDYRPSRASFQYDRARSSKLYEPAIIDPEIDRRKRRLNRIIHYDKKSAVRRVSRAIRRLSKRVMNVHDNSSDSFLLQPQPAHSPYSRNTTTPVEHVDYDSDTSSSPIIDEVIPMKQSISNSSKSSYANEVDTTSPSAANTTHDTTTASSSSTLYYINPEKKDAKEYIQLKGNSLKLFSPTNPFRALLARILCLKWFETCMMLLLVLHGVTLLIVGWGVDPNPEPPSQWGVSWDQYVLLTIFSCYTLIMFIRVFVYGMFMNAVNSKSAYLRHSWNRIDFVSIISYWIDFALIYTGQEIIEEEGRRILVFKMLSALILLRLLNLTDGSRVILNSMKKAAPLLVNVLFFVLFFFVVFAIIGVQSFKGSFKRHCVWHDPQNASNTMEMAQYCGGYINVTDGTTVPYILSNGEHAAWSKGFICENGLVCEETENPFGGTISFDNIFESMLLVMIITGVQSWTDRMYDMMDAEYFVASLYFVIIVIVMNFWLINLFIAVITEMFAKVREDSQHSAFTSSSTKPVLADDEEGWAFDQKREEALKKQTKSSPLHLLVKYMNPFWILLVAVDLLCMAVKNNNMSQEELTALANVEMIFSLMFLVEILLRMLDQRKNLKGFFKDKMNLTDFVIAIVTCIIQIPAIRNNTLVYIWFTGFQVLRVYRLVVAVPRLRSLMSRVLGSVHGLLNLVLFIVMSTLIGAIIAYQLFEGVIESGQDKEMRFFSVYNSFVGLYQLFSGEDWTTVLYDVMEAGSTNHNSAIYALFLVFWFAFSNFVLVNMFIAVLMENFEIAEDDKRKNQIEHYMRKTEDENDKKTVVSRWNIYRYFKAQPKGLDVTNMPSNLVLSVQKNIVREFMNEAEQQQQTTSEPILRSSKPDTQEEHGILHKVRNFLTELFPDPNGAMGADSAKRNHRNTMYLDPVNNAFEQVGTFYDFKKKGGATNEPRSLRYLVDPSLRETVASRFQQENADHDIEERKALKRDFILAHPSYDKSLYIFSSSNRIRRWCQLIVQPSRGERIFGTAPSRWGSLIFLTIITCCVVVNVILTVYNSPVYQFENRDNPSAVKPFVYIDWAFMVIFTLEFVIKVIADGFILTPNAYMLNGWNLLDLFVLVTLYMSNFGRFSGATGLERGFRAFKALRALRLINLLGPAKETFTAILVTGLPRILDAAALGLCLIVPFALYGQNVFMGLFYNCNDDDAATKMACLNEGMLGMQEPQPDDANVYMPRVWDNPYVYSFDSFWSSLLILFEICSGEGWIDVLTTSMSVVGKDYATQEDASQLWGIFFMVYNLAGSVFVISLFLGVVIENFTKRNGTAYLTSDQRRWLDLKKLLNQFRPAKRPKVVPSNAIRKLCFNLTVEKRGRFYKFMTVIISLNILFLCTDTARESDGMDNGATGWSRIKVYIYLVFIFIYWLEITIKLLGLGWKSFRKNLWNLFDLTMVIGSFITAIITLGNPNLQVNVESQKLFMTALCFKLVQRSDSLNQLFTTMAASAYQIVNVFAVWFVVLTTYAIMFMQIFGLTKYGHSAQTEHMNFRSYSNTMISLVRYSTGEGWNSIMHDFTVEYPNCVVAENYLDSDCGSLRWSYFLFLTFNIISMYIFIAIFVAVVADNFSYVYQIKANFSLVNRDEIRNFKMVWASVDTERTGYVMPDQYMTLWRRLQGIFTVRIFPVEYSYKNLVKECSTNVVNDDLYANNLDMEALNQKLSLLDKREIHAKRHDLEKIYWETALVESTTRGVSFNQMLLMLAQRKLIVPENALILEELLENQKKEEAINTLISIDRVRGLMETIALRKKFVRHLESIKKQKAVVPEIVVDNSVVTPSDIVEGNILTPIISHHQTNQTRSYNGDSAISSVNYDGSSFYDHYLSSDEEEGQDNEEEEILEDEVEEESVIIEDLPSHDIWKEMLKDAEK